MPQSIVRLPESTEIRIPKWDIVIENHRVVSEMGLFGGIGHILDNSREDETTLELFEEGGISYESFIEYCVEELDEEPTTLAYAILRLDGILQTIGSYSDSRFGRIVNFSASEAGRSIAVDIIDKIRDCHNWREFYNELHETGKFQKDMADRVTKEWNQ